MRTARAITLLAACGLSALANAQESSIAMRPVPHDGGEIAVSRPGPYVCEGTQCPIVTVTAKAAPGYRFSGWSGSCKGQAAECKLAMNRSHFAVAQFSAEEDR